MRRRVQGARLRPFGCGSSRRVGDLNSGLFEVMKELRFRNSQKYVLLVLCDEYMENLCIDLLEILNRKKRVRNFCHFCFFQCLKQIYFYQRVRMFEK